MEGKSSQYVRIAEEIFFRYYQPGSVEVIFEPSEIHKVAAEFGLKHIHNVGDVISSFRFRAALPSKIKKTAPNGFEWVICKANSSHYRFVLTPFVAINPTEGLVVIRLPDATPGIIVRYALDTQQSLLAKLRYNRLIDIFTGITCYSLTNHLSVKSSDLNQADIIEIYIGIDGRGAHYVLPIRTSYHQDKISVVQIEQDIAMCESKFPALICRPIAAQFMADHVIALFQFEQTEEGVGIAVEKHYKLVSLDQFSPEELARYVQRALQS